MEKIDYSEVVEKIKKSDKSFEFEPANPELLAKLKKYNLPEHIVGFYENYDPGNLEGAVYLDCLDGVLVENEESWLGCNTSKHGFIVFATTGCGDGICFNLNNMIDGTPEIVHLSHDEDYSEATKEEIAKDAQHICDSFMEFLEIFADGDPDEKFEPDFSW